MKCRFKKRAWLIGILIFISLLIPIWVKLVYGPKDLGVSWDKHYYNVETRINGEWVIQVHADIKDHSRNNITIDWYLWGEPDPRRITIFENPQANAYLLFLDIRPEISNNTHKIRYTFYVSWFKGKTLIDIDTKTQAVRVRDQFGYSVNLSDISKIRRYEGHQGELN